MSLRALLAVALLLGEPVRADAWDDIVGRWTGGGEVRGMAASVELEFRRALDGRGRHLTFQNRMRGKDGGERLFQAEALYLCETGGACRGQWFDSRGVTLPLTVAVDAGRVIVDWGDAASEHGRTTYSLNADGTLDVTDEVQGKDGMWRVFGRTRLTRVPCAQTCADCPSSGQ